MKNLTATVSNLNLQNYTGETISLSMKDGRFSMYDYDFTIVPRETMHVYRGEYITTYQLLSEGEAVESYSDDLDSHSSYFHVAHEEGAAQKELAEAMLKKSIRYIANHF